MSEEIDKIYLKAFNNAYLLAKYEMKIIESVLDSKNDGIYFSGLVDGKKTFDKEQKLSRGKELDKIRSKTKNKDLER